MRANQSPFSSALVLVLVSAAGTGCGFFGMDPAAKQASQQAQPEPARAQPAPAEPATPRATSATTASASAAPEAPPARAAVDLSEHGLPLILELPSDVKLEKNSSKAGGVDVDGGRSAGWKTGLSILKADATRSALPWWKQAIQSRKGKVLREEAGFFVHFVPVNQHGFVMLVKAGKDTYVCQNHGAAESEAELGPVIEACKTLQPKP